MPTPRPFSSLPDSVVDLRLCRNPNCTEQTYWGMYHEQGLCFRCRRPGAPRPPWSQAAPAKETP